MTFHVPEKCRIRDGWMGSDPEHGNNGAFLLKIKGIRLLAIVSDQYGWEHVSITVRDAKRCPTWDEMCAVKDQFWSPEDAVMQLHPPASEHISNHPYCLHLWRPTEQTIPMPPSIMVGHKSLGEMRT